MTFVYAKVDHSKKEEHFFGSKADQRVNYSGLFLHILTFQKDIETALSPQAKKSLMLVIGTLFHHQFVINFVFVKKIFLYLIKQIDKSFRLRKMFVLFPIQNVRFL